MPIFHPPLLRHFHKLQGFVRPCWHGNSTRISKVPCWQCNLNSPIASSFNVFDQSYNPRVLLTNITISYPNKCKLTTIFYTDYISTFKTNSSTRSMKHRTFENIIKLHARLKASTLPQSWLLGLSFVKRVKRMNKCHCFVLINVSAFWPSWEKQNMFKVCLCSLSEVSNTFSYYMKQSMVKKWQLLLRSIHLFYLPMTLIIHQ